MNCYKPCDTVRPVRIYLGNEGENCAQVCGRNWMDCSRDPRGLTLEDFWTLGQECQLDDRTVHTAPFEPYYGLIAGEATIVVQSLAASESGICEQVYWYRANHFSAQCRESASASILLRC